MAETFAKINDRVKSRSPGAAALSKSGLLFFDQTVQDTASFAKSQTQSIKAEERAFSRTQSQAAAEKHKPKAPQTATQQALAAPKRTKLRESLLTRTV